MRINYGELFHQKSKDRTMEGLVYIPSDHTLWPKDWFVVDYKEYTRSKVIHLPKPESKVEDQENILSRESLRDFSPNKPITLQSLSNLLYFSCGETKVNANKETRRVQPSGGGRYPLEVYILNLQAGELPANCYHYNVKNHTLEELWPCFSRKEDLDALFSYTWAKNASFAIVLTTIPKRSVKKYGERGYRYIYIEAGIVAGNLIRNALCEDFYSVVMAGIVDETMDQFLDIDGISETVVIGILFGKK
jgi:SagB-type dehydrogenase family enzyme